MGLQKLHPEGDSPVDLSEGRELVDDPWLLPQVGNPFQQRPDFLRGQRWSLVGLQHLSLRIPRQVGPLQLFGMDSFALEVLNQGVVVCLQVQLESSLCQLLEAMREKSRPQWGRCVSTLFEGIPIPGLGQHAGHDASAAVLEEEQVALVQSQLSPA